MVRFFAAALSALTLFACTTAPTPVAKKPVIAPVAVPLTLANVVKQVAPKAKRAIVYGRKEAAAELTAVGIQADIAGAEVDRSGCIRDVDPTYDVVVADEVTLPYEAGLLPHICGLVDVLLVARAKKYLHEVIDDRHGRIFVEDTCVGRACDVFRIEAGAPNRWFITAGLPLSIYVDGLSHWSDDGTRKATGVLVGDAIVLDGPARVRVSGVDVSKAALIDRAALVGWFQDPQVPERVNGIAKISGRVKLDGTLGLAHDYRNFVVPDDAPPMFAGLDAPTVLATMTSARIHYVLDGTALTQLNAKDDAAWRAAAKDPAPSAPLRAVYEEMRKVDDRLGRVVTLEIAVDALETAEKSADPYALARALLRIDNEDERKLRTPAQQELVSALFARICATLGPIAEGSNPTAARRANGVLWFLYFKTSRPNVDDSLFTRLQRRFGVGTPSNVVEP